MNNFSFDHKKPNVLLCCTGSVASVKIPHLAAELKQSFNIVIVCTQSSKHFLSKCKAYNYHQWKQFLSIGGDDIILDDEDEWSSWNKLGDPVLHIELRRWADIVVVAPASADILAKAANGISDNLLLCVLRAWDFSRPCLMCPAMNPYMLQHPSMVQHVNNLQNYGWKFVSSAIKNLACGEVGDGALAEVRTIVDTVMATIDTAMVSERSLEKNQAAEKIAKIIIKKKSDKKLFVNVYRKCALDYGMILVCGILVGIVSTHCIKKLK